MADFACPVSASGGSHYARCPACPSTQDKHILDERKRAITRRLARSPPPPGLFVHRHPRERFLLDTHSDTRRIPVHSSPAFDRAESGRSSPIRSLFAPFHLMGVPLPHFGKPHRPAHKATLSDSTTTCLAGCVTAAVPVVLIPIPSARWSGSGFFVIQP